MVYPPAEPSDRHGWRECRFCRSKNLPARAAALGILPIAALVPPCTSFSGTKLCFVLRARLTQLSYRRVIEK